LVGGLGAILSVFIEMYTQQGHSVEEVVNLTTYPSLVTGCASFVVLPLAMMFGRRPVFLGACLLLIATTVGAAMSNTLGTHMACRVLQGFAAGTTESVLPLIITDMSFLDERGLWFGIYWGMQTVVNTVFTISSSYLVAATSWRWFYWVILILACVGTVMAFFLLSETRYQCSPMSLNGYVVRTDEFGVTHVLSDAEAIQRFGAVQETNEDAVPAQKTCLQHLKPFSGAAPHSVELGFGALIKMFESLTSPAVIWV
jgi:MFS family permease